MPFKDKDKKLAYQRRYYHENEEQRQKQIKRVAIRKWVDYGGICIICGNPTMGNTKGAAPEFCSDPHCKSMQMLEMVGKVKIPRKENK